MNDNVALETGSEKTVIASVGEAADNRTNPLPCRGCTRSCTDYARCDGKPWRLLE